MSIATEVEKLEAALLNRAHRLAEEYRIRAQHSRDHILEEANERLRLREEQEVLAAKALAERVYRRRVQASELKLQGELDRLRWRWVQAVVEDLRQRLAALAEDEARYLPIFQQWLGAAAIAIEREELTAEVNKRDLQRLAEKWPRIAIVAAADKHIALSPEPLTCGGGVKLVSNDRCIRVDNTFEGRLERLVEELHQTIIGRLFAQLVPVERAFHG